MLRALHVVYSQRVNGRMCLSSLAKASDHIAGLRGLFACPEDVIQTEDIDKYTVDWTRVYRGGTVVALPRSTKDVSAIMRYCHANRIGVVPQGGNTGLVGGQVGNGDQLIISLERMNKLISFDATSGVAIAEAGIVLEALTQQLDAFDYMVPLDLGSKGSCQIGGNVATNAGGLRVIKYGSMHQNVLGLEVVSATGDRIDLLNSIRKDNFGYHLKNLFIGSEGTLGIITKVALQAVVRPTSTSVMLLKLRSFDQLSKLLQVAKSSLGELLTAFEFMDSPSLFAMQQNPTSNLLSRLPLECVPRLDQPSLAGELLVLIELSSNAAQIDFNRIERFVERAAEDDLIVDSIVSSDSSQEKYFWSIRESVPVVLMNTSRTQPRQSRLGRLFKYDVSLALQHMPTLVTTLSDACTRQGLKVRGKRSNAGSKQDASEEHLWREHVELDICCFGHAGDQNLHLNVLLRVLHSFPDAGSYPLSNEAVADIHHQVKELLDSTIFSTVVQFRGSISAEHGVGQQKSALLIDIKQESELQMIRSIKTLFDPIGLLNPGKVIPRL